MVLLAAKVSIFILFLFFSQIKRVFRRSVNVVKSIRKYKGKKRSVVGE